MPDFKNFQKRKRRNLSYTGKDGPLAYCTYQDVETGKILSVRVYIIKLFQDNLTCVCFYGNSHTFGCNGYWMVQNGIDWKLFLRTMLQCYQHNQRTPVQFRPKKRIPEDVLEMASQVEDNDLVDLFIRLRQKGFLPKIPVLMPSTCPTQLKWEYLRRNFQKF
ncbi:MAG: hypothetical protein HQK83_06245 [Fibrobacteria bacterium]|nr:hypothetical protein [Fibrobacteria bacterium]